MEDLRVVFIVVAEARGFFSLVLLVFGSLATGATRQNIYSGAKCIMGGRISAIFVRPSEFYNLLEILRSCWDLKTFLVYPRLNVIFLCG